MHIVQRKRRVIKHGRAMPAPKQYLNGEDNENDLNGLLSKLRKLSRKLTKPLQKVLPKPLRKVTEKIEKKVDKLANNKTLNKIGDVAAVAVGSYFFPPMAAMAKSYLVNKGVSKIGEKYAERQAEKQEDALQKEIAALQKANDVAMQSAPVYAEQLSPQSKAIIEQQIALYGQDGLKTPESLEAMKSAIVRTAETTAYNATATGEPYGNILAAQAVAEQTEDRVNEAQSKSFLKNNWPVFAVVGGGLVLLYLNRSKR